MLTSYFDYKFKMFKFTRYEIECRGGIFKLLWSTTIDSGESIPRAYVARRAGTRNLFLLGSWPPQIVQKFQHRSKKETGYKKARGGGVGESEMSLYPFPFIYHI